MALLSRDDINSALRDLPGWRLAHNAIVKEFTFAGFPEAVAFVNRLVPGSEAAEFVSFDDSVSPEFHELEREAIFERAWLNVGRMEQLPRNGSFFTKDLPGLRTSVIVTRDLEGCVRAFHNVCRHRGNKLLWGRTPRDETSGNARQFVCKYHGWRYGLDGGCRYVHQQGEFRPKREDELGLAPLRCDSWAGFVFVNLDHEPRQTLKEYLGPMIVALGGYPFHEMTERYSFRAENASNWKVFSDACQEYYHVPPLHTHQLGPTPESRNPEYEFEAAHYQLVECCPRVWTLQCQRYGLALLSSATR